MSIVTFDWDLPAVPSEYLSFTLSVLNESGENVLQRSTDPTITSVSTSELEVDEEYTINVTSYCDKDAPTNTTTKTFTVPITSTPQEKFIVKIKYITRSNSSIQKFGLYSQWASYEGSLDPNAILVTSTLSAHSSFSFLYESALLTTNKIKDLINEPNKLFIALRDVSLISCDGLLVKLNGVKVGFLNDILLDNMIYAIDFTPLGINIDTLSPTDEIELTYFNLQDHPDIESIKTFYNIPELVC